MEEYVAVLEQQGLKPSSGDKSLSVLRQKVRGTQSNPTPFPILIDSEGFEHFGCT
jgi:hypothetical protein